MLVILGCVLICCIIFGAIYLLFLNGFQIMIKMHKVKNF